MKTLLRSVADLKRSKIKVTVKDAKMPKSFLPQLRRRWSDLLQQTKMLHNGPSIA